MSPLRRHGGGRPRSAVSVLTIAERWGISERAARRLTVRNLSDEAMAVLALDSQHLADVQSRWRRPQGKYSGGLRQLGMRSRMPACRP
jgi:hypothetical protein